MKEKKYTNTNNFEGFPNELKNHMKESFLSYNLESREQAIEYLWYCYENKTIADIMFVKMLDEFMRNIMFPLEFSSSAWSLKSHKIEKLLNAEESILKEQFQHKNMWSNPVTEDMDGCAPEMLIQRLELYYCVLHRTMLQKRKYTKQLNKILEITKRNVKYLLTSKNAKSTYESEVYGVDDFYLIGFEPFEEPLSTLYHNFGFSDYYSDIFIDTYSQYLCFIREFKCDNSEQEAVRATMERIATDRLEGLFVQKRRNDSIDQKFKQEDHRKIKKSILFEIVPITLQAIALLWFTVYAHLNRFQTTPAVKTILIESVLFAFSLALVWAKDKLHLFTLSQRHHISLKETALIVVINPLLINFVLTICITAIYFYLLFLLNDETYDFHNLLFFSLECAGAIEFITVLRHLKPKLFEFLGNLLVKDEEDEFEPDCF